MQSGRHLATAPALVPEAHIAAPSRRVPGRIRGAEMQVSYRLQADLQGRRSGDGGGNVWRCWAIKPQHHGQHATTSSTLEPDTSIENIVNHGTTHPESTTAFTRLLTWTSPQHPPRTSPPHSPSTARASRPSVGQAPYAKARPPRFGRRHLTARR